MQQTFEQFTLEYPIQGERWGSARWEIALGTYHQTIRSLTTYLRENPDVDDDTQSARRLYQALNILGVSHREWEVLLRQAWRQVHWEEAPSIFADRSSRIVLPITDVEFGDDSRVRVRFDGVTILDGQWQVPDDSMWRDFATIPGKVVAISQKTDERGGKSFAMAIQVFKPIVGSPRDMAG